MRSGRTCCQACEGWAWRRPYLALTMLDKMVASFTVLVAPVYMGFAIAGQQWRFVFTLFVWWWVSRSAKLLPHLRRTIRQVFPKVFPRDSG